MYKGQLRERGVLIRPEENRLGPFWLWMYMNAQQPEIFFWRSFNQSGEGKLFHAEEKSDST
jgi:hypothetical protein